MTSEPATRVEAPKTSPRPAAETTPPEGSPEMREAAGEMPAKKAEPQAAAADTLRAPTTQPVARAAFTSDVVEREPVDAIHELPAGADHAIFFTELQGLAGRTVTHRWEYNGDVMAEVSFDVGGDRWRVHSRKRILPEWSGRWSVVVLDDGETELARRSLDVAEQVAGEASPAPETPPRSGDAADPAAPGAASP